MRRWKETDYDSYYEYLKMEGYREWYADCCMMINLLIILDRGREGKITKQQRKEFLNKICPGWSEEEICKFADSKVGSPDRKAGYERMETDRTDMWKKYYDEGKGEYYESRTRREKCGKLQNKIADYAEEKKLFQDSIIKEQYRYGMVIRMARELRKAGDNFLDNAIKRTLTNQQDEQELLQIAQIMEDAKFGEYGGIKREEYEFRQEANEITLLDTIVELVYRMYIRGKQEPDGIKKLLKEAVSFTILYVSKESIESSLQEHIDRMEAIFDKDIYPVDVILQMLGYLALSREEYNQRVAVMKKEIEEIWENIPIKMR